jgi:spermidine synthase
VSDKKKLLIAVFFSGLGVMVLELVGTRVVAPYLGTSLYVWTALIGVMMGSIALGYYWGGEQSGHFSSFGKISELLLWTAVWIFLTSWGKEIFLESVVGLISWEKLQVVAATIGLFAIPGILMGAIFPFAAKLAIKSVKESGFEVGKLYAMSTVGSIVGTFATGFWLVPILGNLRILIGLAIVLSAASLTISSNKFWIKISLLTLFAVGFWQPWSLRSLSMREVVEDVDTAYYRVWLKDFVISQGVKRVITIGRSSQSAVILGNDNYLAFPYYNFYNLMAWHNARPEKVLMVGGAGMGYPRFLLSKFPQSDLTVVEIDKGLYKLAMEKMQFKENERLKMVFEDGRVFLNRNNQKYNAILFDVFSGFTIPGHMVSREALVQVRESLTDDGVVVLNMLGSLEGSGSEVVRAVTSTYSSMFKSVELFTVNHPPSERGKLQNVILVASDKTLDSDDNSLRQEDKRLLSAKADKPLAGLILTDDWSPLENYSYKMLK